MIHIFRQLKDLDTLGPTRGSGDMRAWVPPSTSICEASTGRSLITHLIETLRLKPSETCLLPAYTAEGVIRPFQGKGIHIKFYRVDARLFADPAHIQQLLQQDSSIRICVLIHPFGFEQPLAETLSLLRGRRVWVLEDCAQALFGRSSTGRLLGAAGDFALFSLNKFLPTPDGAILLSHRPEIDVAMKEPAANPEMEKAHSIYFQHLRDNYTLGKCDNTAGARKALADSADSYERYYAIMNRQPNAAPVCARTASILRTIDVANFKTARVRNARYLYENMRNPAMRFVYKEYAPNIIPMTVPVYVPGGERERIARFLFKQGAHLATLTDKWDFVPQGAERDYPMARRFIDSHLLLPVNEFISPNRMKHLVERLNAV